ncbi:hypothetical protein AAMO2058_001098600 [Amorphochlora amoebiformis]
MMNRGMMELSHSEVLARSGNTEHAPRFDIGDFPPLGGSSGMIMGKGELDAMVMGSHQGMEPSLLMQAREKMKAENSQGGRTWWSGFLDMDGQDGKNVHTSSEHPGADFIQSKEDFPALPSKSRSEPAGLNIHSRLQQRSMGVPNDNSYLLKADSKGTNGTQLSSVATKLAGGAAPTNFIRSKHEHAQQQAQLQQASSKADNQEDADRYGLKGLLRVIRMTDPALNTLALGTDLTKLGLNLNSSDALYATFAYPCAENASRREPDFVLPYCYYMQPPALKTSHLGKFELLTLFYIFYNMPKDTLQVYAAKELYNRDWRYHKELKMWFTRPSESDFRSLKDVSTYGGGYERGSIIYFDINSWEQRVFREGQLPGGPKFMTEHELNTS